MAVNSNDGKSILTPTFEPTENVNSVAYFQNVLCDSIA